MQVALFLQLVGQINLLGEAAPTNGPDKVCNTFKAVFLHNQFNTFWMRCNDTGRCVGMIPDYLWLSPWPLLLSWLRPFRSSICADLGLHFTAAPPFFFTRRPWDLVAQAVWQFKVGHSLTPWNCSRTSSGPLRSFNLKIFVMTLLSSVGWRWKKNPSSLVPINPVWCHLLRQVNDWASKWLLLQQWVEEGLGVSFSNWIMIYIGKYFAHVLYEWTT